MKKNLFWAASLACLCASCANDAVIDENRASDEIRFRAFAEGSTRAAAIYSPSTLPGTFTVYAELDNALIIDGDVVTLTDDKWVNSNTRYWPESGTVTFKAVAGIANEDGIADKSDLTNYTVKSSAAQQEDILYACATGSKTENDGTVALNFRHALSQIVFNATNSDESLIVKVSKVKVCNASGSGTYTLPTANTTDQNISTDPNIPTDEEDNYSTAGRGKWTNFGDAASYEITTDITLDKTTKSMDISATSDNKGKALMLIPNENLVAWDHTDAIDDDTTGTYILLTVKIQQKVNNSETEVTIWDGDVAIPVSFGNWVEGKRYVYTFAFGKGNGGYDPEHPNTPIFVPIDFTVTVDEFVSVKSEVSVNPIAKD